jgi:GH15 family glucan-1,4-alpha-glucosidase
MPIEDYALIGNMRTAALVSRNGSIDWACAPRFDSSAFFAALLGDVENGRWRIAPTDEQARVERSYRGDTLVLETVFATEGGEVSLIDFMPVDHEADDRVDLARLVVGRRGEVAMRQEITLRFDYGRAKPWLRRAEGGVRGVAGPDGVLLTTPVELVNEDFSTRSEFTVRAGEAVPFVLTWSPSHKPPPSPLDALAALSETEAWWRDWAAQCAYEGRARNAVVRSLLTLKALTYAPTGGVLAAPTTSLPEAPGGERNWDYRHCWVRDATMVLYALLSSGYRSEAEAWRAWLLRAVGGEPGQLQILYGLNGERRRPELELPWLPGFDGSRPVRIGNAAHAQFQLDVYGEVMDTLHAARRREIELRDDSWDLQRAILEFLDANWSKPDHGMWEVRGPRRSFTHSKVMAWVAFDRAIKAVERRRLAGPADRWRALRAEIHADVCRRGFSAERRSFVQYYGGQSLDAGLLMIPLVGFLPCDDPRVQATVAAIERDLMSDGFVRRYEHDPDVDGLPPGEGAFIACSFWLCEVLAMSGRRGDAERLFERLLGARNDVGLLAEEYDPAAKRLCGNFPQAFSHVALVNAAHRLEPQSRRGVEERSEDDHGG